MLEFIKLELRKVRIGAYITGVVPTNLVIAVFLPFVTFDSFSGAFTDTGTVVRAIFIIFAAVLLSRIVIEEYKSGTVSILFTYPVSRKQVLLSKLLLAGAFTFIGIVLSTFFLNLVLYLLDQAVDLIPGEPSGAQFAQHAAHTAAHAAIAACMSYITLCIGMRKISVAAAILSSILIVAVVYSSNNGFSLSSVLLVPLSLGALGILMTILTFRNINKTDVG